MVDDDAAAEVLDDDALDDDELDPHPAITAAIMATATAPALMRARSDLNMVLLLLSLARVPVRIDSPPGSAKAKRFDQLAASPRR